MIEGHQRITCIFVVGCNNIEIRTCEVVVLKYETRIAEIRWCAGNRIVSSAGGEIVCGDYEETYGR